MITYLQRSTVAKVMAIAITLVLYCGGSHFAIAEEQVVTKEVLEERLGQLGDNSFAVRENASDFLSRYPDQVMPLVIERLSANQLKSEAPLPEASLRMFRLLSIWAADPGTPMGAKAVEGLQRLSQGTSLVTTVRAQSLMTEMMFEYSDVVEARLQSLGAFIGFQPTQIGAIQFADRRMLRLDDSFQGTPESLKTMKWLVDIDLVHARGKMVTPELLKCIASMPKLRILQLREANLSKEDLALLNDIEGLEVLEILYTPLQPDALSELADLPVSQTMRLFGTGLDSNSIEELRSQLEGVELLHGQGGFLGIVGGADNLIARIVANGAAEQAGLQEGDKIVAINKAPITKFDEIRAELSKHGPRDKINVDFERKSTQVDDSGHQSIVWQPMSTEVTLGMQD